MLVTEIGIYVLLAVGLNVVVGWAGLLDLGFIAFYAIGSYTTAYLTGSLPIKPPSWLHMSPLLAIPFAILVCLLAGVALGAPTLRLRGDYLAIVTLGFGEIIRIVAVTTPASSPTAARGRAPRCRTRSSTSARCTSPGAEPVAVLVPAAGLHRWSCCWPSDRLENSRLGRAWAAIREDEVAAQATGVNTFRIKLLAFAIGASTSGVAGVFFASQIGFFNPDNFVLNNSILVVAYVVFGGMGSLPGAMAGAAVLTWLPEFLKDQVPAADRQMWIGAVVLLMMIFRPRWPDPGPQACGGVGRAATGRSRRRSRQRCRPAKGGCEHDERPQRRDPTGEDVVVRRPAGHPALRRCDQPERRVAADAPRRDPGRHRAERRRQDLAVQLAHRGVHAAGGQHRRPGPGRRLADQRDRDARPTWSTTSGSPGRSRTSGCSRR